MGADKQKCQDIATEKEVACKQSTEAMELRGSREVQELLSPSPTSYQGKITGGCSRRARPVIFDGKKMG